MPADGPPAEEHSLLAQPLGWITGRVVRAPRLVVGFAIAMAMLSIGIAATKLEMHTSRLDLLNPQSAYNQLWLDYVDDFGGEDDAVVVIEGAQRETVIPALEQVAYELRQHPDLFRNILFKVDLTPLRSKRLHYLSPEQLAQLEQFLARVEPVTQGNWSSLQLSSVVQGLGDAAQSPEPELREPARRTLEAHVENLHAALRGESAYRSPWPPMQFDGVGEDPFSTQYLLTGDDRIGLILLRLVDDDSSFERGTAAIDRLRKLLAAAEQQLPDVQIGLTGLPVMENDEMRASSDATIEASVLSLSGVLLIFIVGFGGLRHPLMAVASLVLAIGWGLAYIVFSVGHLNILSMSFGLILIGLGIDFGIHYVARYFHERQSEPTSEAALVATADAVGPGVVTGGMTTAIAFFAAGLTDFTGIAELGVIAGGGVVLCLVGTLLVLPAMIQLGDRNRPGLLQPRLLSVHRWFGFTRRLPLTTLAVSLAITGVCCLGLDKLWYDHNLLNLQPVGLESIKLEQRLLEETDQSVWYAISLAGTREELLARKAHFEALESVERTEEIASLIPADEQSRIPTLQRMTAQLAALPQEPPQLAVDPPAELARLLGAAYQQLGIPIDSPSGRTCKRVIEMLERGPVPDSYRALAGYQQRLAHDLLLRLQALRDASNPESPQLADLPESLVERFVGDSGRYMLKVYSKADIWDMDALRRFVHDVRSVDPRATGQPLQTYEASRQMQRSYLHAAMYALIAVLIVLMLDFRSLRYSLCALLPVGLGMAQMFGVMGLLDIPLNPANMIVLPLILGIGLDYGVHVLHDFRRTPGQYRLSRATATGVVITSLTTMVGFGSMMIADHRGLESLGRVLTLGVACCTFMALAPLPALLAWLSRDDGEEAN